LGTGGGVEAQGFGLPGCAPERYCVEPVVPQIALVLPANSNPSEQKWTHAQEPMPSA
jgi:hypothetical protein